ncbi:glycosyltransferase [Pseudomonas sp. TNT3]|uniref:glycosyltransferase n=1 Tax=Pseudomonas sp. TNT3 TaxID=2654097 RepID=UPI001390CAE0|nr:glycosyltransferase [Pseudomonas sp. TNT3]KAI2689531.1 glycosyltransferase [Pseudomonas sp. TNT3]
MAALLANCQASNGHMVTVIYSRRNETPKDFESHFHRNISLINIQMSSMAEKLTCLAKIRSALIDLSPNCIFMHSSFAGFLGRLATIATLGNTKFFYLPHCISFMRKDIGLLKKYLFVIFEWFACIKNADYVACSESERMAITKFIPFRRCHLVENALDLNSIPQMQQKNISQRKKIVITVGQIRPQKRPDLFSEIARIVKTEDPHVEFLWVGDGEADARRQLEQSGVKVLGWVSKEQVWQYLSGARLYLSTAAWEGMPVSVIEASFVGLPVVASSCAGNVDVITHNENGWLYKTAAEASEYIHSSLENPEYSRSIARSAHDIALQRFNVERYFREMETLSQY